MKLDHGLHLAYCTNIHRGENWAQTFDTLKHYTLAVRQRVCPDAPYAIGLRLGNQAARELSDPAQLLIFQKWLEANHCYVFTINGFPYGQFHGTRVKEHVYMPDWTTRERLDYTTLLFDLIAQLVPDGVEGSVSTVPVSFKEFIHDERQVREARANVWRCVEHIERLTRQTGKRLHLGLEPEPLCYLETSAETVRFFEQLRDDRPGDLRLDEHLGVNYDACHLAVEFEEPQDALGRLHQHGIRLSKIHLSSALKVVPVPEARKMLSAFHDEVYFHQVVQRDTHGQLTRIRDLDVALKQADTQGPEAGSEWRIHFHIPLHCDPARFWGGNIGGMGMKLFDGTADHLLGVLDWLAAHPKACSHLEMETYTWEVLPPELKNRNVVDQLAAEYEWTLARMAERKLFHP